MTRALKITGLALATLVLIVIGTIAWLAGTENGSRFAIEQAEALLPDGISVGEVTGRLADHVELGDVEVTVDSLDLTISRLWLRWSPRALLNGHLRVIEVGAQGVRYRVVPTEQPPPAAEPFRPPERVELPVSVEVERLLIADATVYPAPDAAPVTLNGVEATNVTFADSRLTLGALSVDSPMLNAQGRLTATAADDYPVDADLEWRLDLTDYAPVNATTRMNGTLASLDVEQRIAAPYDTEITGTVGHLVSDQAATLSLRLAAGPVMLSQVREDLPAFRLDAAVRVDGPLEALTVEAELGGTDAEHRRFVADLEAAVTEASIIVERLSVHQPDHQGRITAEGRIALAEEVAADLDVRWESLRWPLTSAPTKESTKQGTKKPGEEPTIVSPRGHLTLAGPLSGYRLTLETRLEPADAPSVDLRLDGGGSRKGAALTLDATVGGGSVSGRLDARWDPDIQGSAELAVAALDPSLLSPNWPGSVNAALSASADTQGEGLQVTVSRLEASGRLRDQPLAVTAEGRYVHGQPWPTLAVERLDATLGATRLNVQGTVAERADLRWALASDSLESLLPEAQGRLSGSGRITGPLPRVTLATTVTARNLGYDDHTLAALDLDADVDLSGETDSRLSLTVQEAILADTSIRRVAVEASGRPADHGLRLWLEGEPGSATLTLTGRVEDPWGRQPAWHYALSRGELAYQDLAPWRLSESGESTLSRERVNVARQCWTSAEARVCLQGQRNPQELSGDVDLANLPLAYFAPLLPEGVELTGRLDASARLSRPEGGMLTARMALGTTAGQVSLPTPVGEDEAGTAVVGLEPSTFTLALDDTKSRALLDLNVEHGRLRLDAATSASAVTGAGGTGIQRPLSDQTLAGSIVVDVPELGFLSGLVPGIDDVSGSVDGNLQLEGSLAQPGLAGTLKLSDGAVAAPATGIALTDLAVALEGHGREVTLQASASSGGGDVRVDGRLSLPGDAPAATLVISGREFQVIDYDDARVLVSPDLTVEAGAERITLAGTVHVPEAEITPGTRSPSAVTASEDQVLLSEQSDEDTATGRELHADVRLTLGDEVHFQGYGLTARIEGDVLVNERPQTPTTATGELNIVDGEYRAYGQGLVIDSGRIYFAGGPVTEPALDVRAVRRPKEGILVGAHVQGTLQSPTFELFSEPTMTQQEQLSYLVLGRSLQETPDGQGSALSRAALAMGLKGGDFLARNIGEQVGFDQIGIETGSGEAGAPSDPAEAALVVGKYLSPRLYVSYGIGLFSPESVLEMQYEISKHWTLVTQSSGESTGGDILYTVELGGKRAEAP